MSNNETKLLLKKTSYPAFLALMTRIISSVGLRPNPQTVQQYAFFTASIIEARKEVHKNSDIAHLASFVPTWLRAVRGLEVIISREDLRIIKRLRRVRADFVRQKSQIAFDPSSN